MATVRQYGYYIKGNKVAIVEKDTQFDNDVNSKDYGPGSDRAQYKSPLATVADGLEIQYVYSPKYVINTTNAVDTQIDKYQEVDGYLALVDEGANDYSASPESLADGSYIVLRNAGKFNGLHKVKSAGVGNIITYTRHSGTTALTAFEKTVQLYYDVDVLNDEEDTIDLPVYLSKALVYFLKAKVAEDSLNIDLKEYFMKEFRKMFEKHNNARVAGLRIVSPGHHAIR